MKAICNTLETASGASRNPAHTDQCVRGLAPNQGGDPQLASYHVPAEDDGVHQRAGTQSWPPSTPPLTARLIAKRTLPRPGRRDATLYQVEFDRELVIEDSREPGLDLARVLKARGISGVVVLRDSQTGMARLSINISKAALLTIREDRWRGPMFTRWKSLESDEGPHRTDQTLGPDEGERAQ